MIIKFEHKIQIEIIRNKQERKKKSPSRPKSPPEQISNSTVIIQQK